MFFHSKHHAYLIPADAESALSHIEKSLRDEFSFDTIGNPDYVKIICDHASVDDVHTLQSFQENKSIGERKVALFGFDRITVEAQNKLLKTLEEPRGETLIVLITPNTHILLPTVLSRLERVAFLHEGERIDARTFLSANEADRLELIAPYIESRRVARTLLDGIERVLHEEEDIKRGKEVIETFYDVRGYLTDRGSSVKQLLEYLAVTLPRIEGSTKSEITNP